MFGKPIEEILEKLVIGIERFLFVQTINPVHFKNCRTQMDILIDDSDGKCVDSHGHQEGEQYTWSAKIINSFSIREESED